MPLPLCDEQPNNLIFDINETYSNTTDCDEANGDLLRSAEGRV